MKSKLQLMINGKPVLIPIQLSDEQIRQLTAAVNLDEILTGWEEPKIGQKGYYEDEFNSVAEFDIDEATIDFAQKLYENDNFYSTRETAENTVRADNVLRRLRHYAISHRSKDVTMADGGNAVFSVVANGAHLTYQWQYSTNNGSTWTNSPATGNRTDTLTVPATTSRNGYKYRCVVDGLGGSVTSDSATLTVT